jgi:transcriptional regulator GlxA family with amidase domain
MANNRLSGALDALHVSGGRRRIDELSKYAGCTTRQLNRMFRSNVGLSAKTYAQLVQFHRTLKLIQCERLSITVAAFEGGYADQAHLTRAFQRFGGFTPSNVPHDLSLPMLFT